MRWNADFPLHPVVGSPLKVAFVQSTLAMFHCIMHFSVFYSLLLQKQVAFYGLLGREGGRRGGGPQVSLRMGVAGQRKSV